MLGNCYDAHQYGDYSLYCPYAHRLPNGTILAKDLAAEYNYLGNSSIWFYNARTKAQEIIDKNSPIYRGEWRAVQSVQWQCSNYHYISFPSQNYLA